MNLKDIADGFVSYIETAITREPFDLPPEEEGAPDCCFDYEKKKWVGFLVEGRPSISYIDPATPCIEVAPEDNANAELGLIHPEEALL